MKGNFLDFPGHVSQIDQQAIHLCHPEQRVLLDQARKRPLRIERPDPNRFFDSACLGVDGALADIECGAQVPPSSCAEKTICRRENLSSQEHRRCRTPTFVVVRKLPGSGASCKAPGSLHAPSPGIRSLDACRKHRRSSRQSSGRLAASFLEPSSSEGEPSSKQP